MWRRLIKPIGYGLFFVFAFTMGLYYTFPYDAARDRWAAQLRMGKGVRATIGHIVPKWLGGLRILDSKVFFHQEAASGEHAVEIPRVDLHMHIVTLLRGCLGGSVRAVLGGGAVDAEADFLRDRTSIRVRAEKVDLRTVAFLRELIGLPLYGTADIDAALSLHRDDAKLSEGELRLTTTGLGIEKGGRVGMIPLPELELGNLALAFPIRDGRAELKSVKLSGTDIEILLDGTIAIAPEPAKQGEKWSAPVDAFGTMLSKSTLNLVIGAKPTEKFLTANPMLVPILKNVESAKDGEGFYGVAVTGSFQFPRTQPRRR